MNTVVIDTNTETETAPPTVAEQVADAVGDTLETAVEIAREISATDNELHQIREMIVEHNRHVDERIDHALREMRDIVEQNAAAVIGTTVAVADDIIDNLEEEIADSEEDIVDSVVDEIPPVEVVTDDSAIVVEEPTERKSRRRSARWI